MPWKADILIPLDPVDPEGDRVRLRLNRERNVLLGFVVQYETPKTGAAGEYYAVVRYDGSYGRPHRDLLDARGETRRKSVLPDHLTFTDAAHDAVDDIRRNWRRYRSAFYRRLRGNR
jgi:hypothetical protein